MAEKKPHSIPVPQLYKEASKILCRYEGKQGSLQTLIYSGKYRNYSRIYGLLCKTVQNSTVIKTALAASKLFIEQPKFNPHLAQVLTAELLGKGYLMGDCKPIEILHEYEDKIKSFVGSNFSKESLHKERDIIPRYVRVNTLVSSVDRVHAQLANDGWKLREYNSTYVTYDDFLQLMENIDESTYLIDYHIPEVLVFPPKTPFWDSILYKKNAIILQDKASCIPVFLSSVKPGANVIDACAAPGNKTSHIAAIMRDTGRVLAIEKDVERFKTLQNLLLQRKAKCVTCLNKNFSKLPQEKHLDVEYIFLDPTCSSSGLSIHHDEVSWQRIKSLSAFQVHLLLYALSFSSVKEVMYSTCSVNKEENEEVVEEALKQYQDEFELEDLRPKLSGWKHFGNRDFVFGERCLRVRTDVDKCQGFFVAKFVRKALKHGDTLNLGKKKDRKRKHSVQDEPSNEGELEEQIHINGVKEKEVKCTGQYSDNENVKVEAMLSEDPSIQSGEPATTNIHKKKKMKRKKDNMCDDTGKEEFEIASKKKRKESRKQTGSDEDSNKESSEIVHVEGSNDPLEVPHIKHKKKKTKKLEKKDESTYEKSGNEEYISEQNVDATGKQKRKESRKRIESNEDDNIKSNKTVQIKFSDDPHEAAQSKRKKKKRKTLERERENIYEESWKEEDYICKENYDILGKQKRKNSREPTENDKDGAESDGNIESNARVNLECSNDPHEFPQGKHKKKKKKKKSSEREDNMYEDPRKEEYITKQNVGITDKQESEDFPRKHTESDEGGNVEAVEVINCSSKRKKQDRKLKQMKGNSMNGEYDEEISYNKDDIQLNGESMFEDASHVSGNTEDINIEAEEVLPHSHKRKHKKKRLKLTD